MKRHNDRRFTDANQIMSAIDLCYIRRDCLLMEAQMEEREAAELRTMDSSRIRAAELFESAKQKRAMAARIIAARAEQLKAKLAEFNTLVLPNVSIDPSVSARIKKPSREKRNRP